MPVTHRFRLRLTLSPLCSPVCLAFVFFFLSAVSGSSVLPALMKPFCNIDLNKSQRITNGNIPFLPLEPPLALLMELRPPPLSLPNGMIVYLAVLAWSHSFHHLVYATAATLQIQAPQSVTPSNFISQPLPRRLPPRGVSRAAAGMEIWLRSFIGGRTMTDCAATKIAMLSGVPPLTAVAGPHNPSTADGNSLWMLAGPRGGEYRSWKQLPGGNAGWANECFQPKPLLRPTHPATRSSKFDLHTTQPPLPTNRLV